MKKLIFLVVVLFLSAAVQALEAPAEDAIKKLTDKSLLLFNQAIHDKDFTAFYRATAKLWQEQTTAEKLQAALLPSVDEGFDFHSAVEEMEPVFEPEAEVNSDGVLVVAGYYATTPKRLTFKLKYIEEDGAWKLVGFNLKTIPAPAKESHGLGSGGK